MYVDAGSPRRTRVYLETKAREKGCRLIRTDHYLSPNLARNLGLRHVDSKYIVFIDNDVLVEPGWLDALVRCADETGAWLVGPLTLIGKPEHQILHVAGGVAHIREEQGKRIFHEEIPFRGRRLNELQMCLRREPSEVAEFHCMLARADLFERLGPLDEQLLSVREHQDLCLTVLAAGGSVYFEPTAVVTFVPPPPLSWSDFPYFMLRWSEAWTLTSLRHFHEKWALDSVPDDLHLAWTRRRYLFLSQFHSLEILTRFIFGRPHPSWLKRRLLSLIERALTPLFVCNTS